MKRHILFVDDEPNVLQGLRRMLRPLRDEWEMSFAQSGEEALQRLAETHVDVVVSDMRMPGMDGAELLAEVSKRHPEVVRIILSGQSDRKAVMKSIGPTHQFLAKPCEPDMLRQIIARAFALRDLLNDSKLKELVSNLKSVPSLPALYHDLMRELQSSEVTMKRVGEIISHDVGMTAKILQLVNSAFFGLAVPVSSPVHAARLLGAEILKALVLSIQIFSQFEHARLGSLRLADLVNHSLRVANFSKIIASAVTDDAKTVDSAFIAGMLHDTGKLVLADNLPDEYARAVELAHGQKMPLWEAEREIFCATHAEVGAYLLGLWGLPDVVVEAVAFHHRPGESQRKRFAPLSAVHAADVFDYEFQTTREDRVHEIDLAHMRQTGLEDRLTEWKELCCKQKGTTKEESDEQASFDCR
ncbi:MAG: HDOD domain-containing protein [Calditrichaeota bacterium]|nr:MAG: HDOD domain-containing protein [Calditrichota bacterium]